MEPSAIDFFKENMKGDKQGKFSKKIPELHDWKNKPNQTTTM